MIMSTVNIQQRLNDLFGYIRQGKIVEDQYAAVTRAM